ncbi:hypothetical protein VIGAN_07205400 [Vigna angularis var. angularis]|uniref:Uncharacterized protein n=1 Tax=Vigna angularis var. angularis TaxID=157739 RepID=A0A0S3SJX0_PHAAN|nr:hypothetical protein VIGAN_07205400 [Vigna angularis var. angularis]
MPFIFSEPFLFQKFCFQTIFNALFIAIDLNFWWKTKQGNKLESLIRLIHDAISAVRCRQRFGANILALAVNFSIGLCIQMFLHLIFFLFINFC